MIISKLSPFNVMENIPVCVKDADLIVSVSKETEETIPEYIKKDVSTLVFPNYADADYFDKYSPDRRYDRITKIAVISNHIPEELIALRDIKKEWEIDLIGESFKPQLVTAELLLEYDLVITIGKTVQFCMALGIPVYVYDYFGGPGYINQDNFEKADKYNFSGRGYYKSDVSDLIENIESEYSSAVEKLPWLNTQANKYFNFQTNFDKMLDTVLLGETVSKTANIYEGGLKDNIEFYSSLIAPRFVNHELLVSQIYWTDDNAFSEQNSEKWEIRSSYTITKEISVPCNASEIRFDPSFYQCKSRIINIESPFEYSCKAVNSVWKKDGWDIFISDDPQYNIRFSGISEKVLNYKIKITYCCDNLDNSIFEELYNEMRTEINDLHSKVNFLQNATIPQKIKRKIKGHSN
ncbi:MAG: hypothetical protein ACK5LL_07455 [Suipraeoptans sp.]